MCTTQLPDIGAYVYCVTRAEPFCNGAPALQARSVTGLDHPLDIVLFRDIAAVVSSSPSSRYDVSRENTIAHEIVVEEAMLRSDVLPVRFNTVAKCPQDVADKLLARRYGELHHLLDLMRGRIELGLKLFWKRDRLFAEIAREDPRIRSLRDAVAATTQEQSHYERIKLGQMTEEAIIVKRDREAEEFLRLLQPLSVEMKVNKVLTDMMLLNAAFLVERSREAVFDETVSALDEAHSDRLIVKYAGPLPPYNFVNLTVRWEEA